MTKAAKATADQRKQADDSGGIVVQHLEDGDVTVVDRHELEYPARAQRVLYVSPEPEPDDDTSADGPTGSGSEN